MINEFKSFIKNVNFQNKQDERMLKLHVLLYEFVKTNEDYKHVIISEKLYQKCVSKFGKASYDSLINLMKEDFENIVNIKKFFIEWQLPILESVKKSLLSSYGITQETIHSLIEQLNWLMENCNFYTIHHIQEDFKKFCNEYGSDISGIYHTCVETGECFVLNEKLKDGVKKISEKYKDVDEEVISDFINDAIDVATKNKDMVVYMVVPQMLKVFGECIYK